MFTFIKRTATSWQHDNGTIKSSFGGGIPIFNDTDNTVIFQLPNGTNFPKEAVLITDCKIIDKTDGDAEYTFTTTTEFNDKLEELSYPYIVTGGGGGGASYTDTTFAQFMETLDAETEIDDANLLNFTDDSQTKQKTITWSNFKGLLKEYFDTVYATVSAVTTAISEALTTAETYTDNALENYYTKTESDTSLALKADNSIFLFQQADRTLTSNTSAQDIFDVGISGNAGALNLLANTTYHFEMELSMTGLSSTSGTISISFDAGTVGVATFKASSVAKKAGFGNASTPQFVFFDSTASVPVVASNSFTTANVFISGTIVTSTAGTFRPRVTMSVASASTVQKGAHLIVNKLGSNTSTHYPLL